MISLTDSALHYGLAILLTPMSSEKKIEYDIYTVTKTYTDSKK